MSEYDSNMEEDLWYGGGWPKADDLTPSYWFHIIKAHWVVDGYLKWDHENPIAKFYTSGEVTDYLEGMVGQRLFEQDDEGQDLYGVTIYTGEDDDDGLPWGSLVASLWMELVGRRNL